MGEPQEIRQKIYLGTKLGWWDQDSTGTWRQGSRPPGHPTSNVYAHARCKGWPSGADKRTFPSPYTRTNVLPGPWHLDTGEDISGTVWADKVTTMNDDGTVTAEKHNSRIFTTRSVPWPYIEHPKPVPIWADYLAETLPSSGMQDLLLEQIGRTISGESVYTSGLPVVYGRTGSGKTTLRRLITRLVGPDMTVEIASAGALGGRFVDARTARAKLIILKLDRTPSAISHNERKGRHMIKSLSGGGSLDVELRWQSYRVKMNLLIWIIGTQLPKWAVPETADGWAARLAPIPLHNPVLKANRIPGLADQIADTGGAHIASAAFQGWAQRRHNYYPLPQESAALREEIIIGSLEK